MRIMKKRAVAAGRRRFGPGIILRSPWWTMLAAAALLAIGFGSVWVLTRGPNQQELERATVHIQRMGADGEPEEFGSGSIIREDGLILTNAHVVDPTAPGLALRYGPREGRAAERFVVSLFAGDEDRPAEPTYRARVVALDGYLDVAVLQIDRTLDGAPVDPTTLELPTVALGDSDRLENDDEIRVLGYPEVGEGEQGTINSDRGSVSGFPPDDILDILRGWIKTSALISPGSSGGLAADERGSLIGIPSQLVYGRENESGGFGGTQGRIRPINLVKPVIRAAEAGEEWTSRAVVDGTGKETFTTLGWTTETPSPGTCPSYSESASFPSGTTALFPVFLARAMTEDEDLQFVWRYQGDADEPEQAVTSAITWKPEADNDCRSAPLPKAVLGDDGTLAEGVYVVEARAGPPLRLIGRAETTVGVPPTGEETPSDPSEFPNSDEETILATLPAGLSESCSREVNEGLFAAASAGVGCAGPGGIAVYYELFLSRDAFAGQYWKLFEEHVEPQGGAKGDDGCGEAAAGEGTYTVGAEKSVAGRVLCFRDKDGKAVLAWKHDRLLILSYALGDKPKPLWRWWANAGPCPPEEFAEACS